MVATTHTNMSPILPAHRTFGETGLLISQESYYTGQRLDHTTPHLTQSNPTDHPGYRYLPFLQLPLTVETVEILVPSTTILVSLGHNPEHLN